MRFAGILVLAAVVFAQSPQYHPVASSKQIMAGVCKPAMDSLVAMNKAGGPKDEKEWELAHQHAALLTETAQLLLMGNRPLDQDVWIKSSKNLEAAAEKVAQAAQSRDVEAWKSSFNTVGSACRSCHNVHKKKQ
ncbi:MAG: cytochrome c [Bryobacteraceae bacterium]